MPKGKTKGVRLLFRVIELMLAGTVFLLFVTPRRVCPAGDYRTMGDRARGCVKREFGSVTCPYIELHLEFMYDTTEPSPTEDHCLFEVYELIVPAAVAFVFLVVYGFDMALGRKLVQWKCVAEIRLQKFYLIYFGISAFAWLSVLVVMSVVLAVRWPQALNLRPATNETEFRKLQNVQPPTSWVVTLFCSCVIVCLNCLEGATLVMFPNNYHYTHSE